MYKQAVKYPSVNSGNTIKQKYKNTSIYADNKYDIPVQTEKDIFFARKLQQDAFLV